MTQRKLYFHRLRMYTLTPNSEGSEQKYFDISKEKEILKDILNSIESDPKFMEFVYKKQSIAIEFITGVDGYLKNSSGIICGKLSHPKDKHAYQLRTKGTPDEEEIAVKQDQIFEARSYFLIDTNSMVIAYLNETSAPRITALGEWISIATNRSEEMATTFGNVTGIATKDMVNNLKKAAYLGTIRYVMEIPKELAAEYTGLSEKDYKKLKNQKTIKIEAQLVANKRGVSTLDDEDDTGTFFKNILKNQLIKRIWVKMKAKKTDHVREVQLVNNPLSYSIDFDFNAIAATDYDETISKRIQSEYEQHIDEINELYS
ncbi:hypothetical protein ACEE97_05885 [Limosilactobacillus reuteri]|uniref:hypothetical protein n=2 Tax=Limosilactobacillus reuteri TaxID=1598 RepID=UPI0025519F6A|nr:hypothetical protein [Limosilactobacillus reuteri]MDK8117374.1 hypothetical protein [Limosilactobacillus reuteri]